MWGHLLFFLFILFAIFVIKMMLLFGFWVVLWVFISGLLVLAAWSVQLHRADQKRQALALDEKRRLDAESERKQAEHWQTQAANERNDAVRHRKAISSDLRELRRNHKRIAFEDAYGVRDETQWRKHLESYAKRKLGVSDEDKIQHLVAYIDGRAKNQSLVENRRQSTPSSRKRLTPEEFESTCAEKLESCGWKAQLTKASGDQGVDIIATKARKKVAAQCKLYSKPVGNKAVQEALAGKEFIGADFACVITNSSFTRSARELAATANVLLLHPDDLDNLDSLTQKA